MLRVHVQSADKKINQSFVTVAPFVLHHKLGFGGVGFLGSSVCCTLNIIIIDEHLRFPHHFKATRQYLIEPNQLCHALLKPPIITQALQEDIIKMLLKSSHLVSQAIICKNLLMDNFLILLFSGTVQDKFFCL
jgi:hypothetical protein